MKVLARGLASFTRVTFTAAALVVAGGAATPAIAAETVRFGTLEIKGSIPERPPEGFFGSPRGHGLRDVVGALYKAAGASDVDAVMIRLKDATLSSAQIEEIGQAIRALRAAGKKVHVFSELYDTAELRLGSYADEVIVQSGGAVSLPGLHMDEMFLADTLRWAGITPDFVQIGDYKGASEMMANARPSEAWNQNINGLLDSMYGILRAELKGGRRLDDAQLDKAMEATWMADADTAIKAGLIDAAVDLPDLEGHFKQAYSATKVTWDKDLLPKPKSELDSSNPFALFSMFTKKPEHKVKRDTIAVVHIDGAIVDGESTGGGLFGGDGSVGSRTIRKALSAIEDESKIKGVVLRIDSPGGSAIASEVIWQGVKRVAAKKPVWVSVGDMAASGGYYIAVSGQKIYVAPSSIVGSIGVVGGKLAMGGLFDMVKVNVVSRSRGPRADMMSMTSAWSPDAKALVKAKMQETYDLFTKRVSAGRNGIDLAKTAEGRLFTGQKAVDLKMADKVGSFRDAVNDLASSLSLSEGGYDLLDYPAPKSFEEMIEDLMGGFGVSTPGVQGSIVGPFSEIARMARQVIGDDAWRTVSTHLDAMMQMHKEPVLLVGPSAIIVR